ncbi:MAG TPA: hemolysin family protein [Propionibacteriaceae bacterium]|nr:hemolysin family protein [Propionibacteriaceae bacterium]
MTEWTLLAVALLLVAACGVFVAAEFALVTVDRPTVERAAAAEDRRASGTLRALRSLSTQLSGAQLGITVTNLAIGFLAEPALAVLLRAPLGAIGVPAAALTPTALTVALILANVVTMIFGELVPKNLAIANPLATSGATQLFQRGFTRAMSWPIKLFNGSANAIVRGLGMEPQEELRSVRSPEEIASLVRRSAREGVLDRDTASLVERSIAFGDKTAEDIMTPRVHMHSVRAQDPVASILDAARQTGHSRFPVVESSADEIVGMVHIKHAVAIDVADRDTVEISQIQQEPLLVPETLPLDPLLTQLRAEGMQLAVVVDEYGGTAGVVTLEDVIEEIVGEISDEHDRLGSRARQQRDGSWSLSGLLRPDEVAAATGVAVPEGENYETLAGLVQERFGFLPQVGDAIEIKIPRQLDLDSDGPDVAGEQLVTFTVQRLEGRRLDRITMVVHDDMGDSQPRRRGRRDDE